MLYNILKDRFNTKHWDQTKCIDSQSIEYIKDCLEKAPHKMAMVRYKVLFITNSESGKLFKNWLFYNHTWNSNGSRTGRHAIDGVIDSEERDYNGQYLAPILIAWLNPIQCPEVGEVNGQRVTFPKFSDRQNNIFISNTIAMIAAQEQGLNTGFGSCHSELEVATRLGFEGYSCPIMLGVGYATNMLKEIELDDVFVPVYDPEDASRKLGSCFVNLPAHYSKPNRELRPSKDEFIKII
jgi:hypothetical protein